jgi:hypothetical protein
MEIASERKFPRTVREKGNPHGFPRIDMNTFYPSPQGCYTIGFNLYLKIGEECGSEPMSDLILVMDNNYSGLIWLKNPAVEFKR